ncbi:aspartate/glutamate racemase family protein [Variovorax robiniae]|uniref:Aspartate/glutamate racemase family protein n=1 Tax=Variovorax robiniae TaxID=1836199 RepID=A0ABU8XF61_9BURK
MRLLLVNSNTSDFVTAKVAAAARDAAAARTEIVPVTGRFGARVISTRTELAIAEHATIDLLAEHAPGCDAVLIAVSYDVALWAAREMLDIPVVGITEAALLTASMLGTRIGVVVFGKRVLPIYRERALQMGIGDRIAGWRAVESTAPYAAGDQSEADALTIAAVRDLVERDGAEVVVLTGAVMAGVPPRLQPHVDVPLLDGISCGVKQAEALAALEPAKPRSGSLAPLPQREMVGVAPAIDALFGHPSNNKKD